MDLRLHHRLVAVLVAITVHLGLLGMLQQPSPAGALSAGSGGLEVALGPSGAAPGSDAPAVPPPDALIASDPETVLTETVVAQELIEPVESKSPEPIETVEVAEPEPQPRAQPTPQARVESRPTPEPAPEQPTELQEPVATPGAGGRSGSQEQPDTDAISRDNTAGGKQVGVSPDYLTRLQSWLERHKQYPTAAQRRRQQGTAMLYFVMNRDGKVLDYRIQQSTGHQLLDREIADMIQRAQPLPPMPETMTQAQLAVVVPVQFSLR